jgi:predicted nucleic acid-binding protein
LTAEGIVLDASVVINVLGCGAAARVLRAIPGRRVIPDITSREILRDPLAPSSPEDPLDALIAAALIERVEITAATMETFLDLVGADPPNDLGDGEAAAIALAIALGLPLALDDTKARRIVREQFSGISMLTSVDLFALPTVAVALADELADTVFSALIHAHMRVLPENDAWVRLLLGERADHCPSLKKRKRR